MNINIGGNLRKLRLDKGLTQEQLAEVFGVSAQAVSRWENNSAYPDITLLPGIAMFYEKSIDEIIGMDAIRREERLYKVHGEVNRLVISGETKAAAELIRDNLRLFPNDSGLLMALGETLAHMDDEKSVEEAISVGERVLKNGEVSMKARCTTTVNLIYLYLKAGRDAAAKELVGSLPHIWEAREMIMPEVSEDEEYTEALKRVVVKALVFLTEKIRSAEAHSRNSMPAYVPLGVDFDNGMDPDRMLELIGDFLR